MDPGSPRQWLPSTPMQGCAVDMPGVRVGVQLLLAPPKDAQTVLEVRDQRMLWPWRLDRSRQETQWLFQPAVVGALSLFPHSQHLFAARLGTKRMLKGEDPLEKKERKEKGEPEQLTGGKDTP